jgi:hypothetical protein
MSNQQSAVSIQQLLASNSWTVRNITAMRQVTADSWRLIAKWKQ